MQIAALIVAAGRGSRSGPGVPKQYREIGGVPLLARTIRALLDSGRIHHVLTCIHPEDAELYRAVAPDDPRLSPPVRGGAERALSVRAGLEALALDPPDLVLIHDAARPFVSSHVIGDVIDALSLHDGAIAAVPVVDALRRSERGLCGAPVAREGVWRAQTPQGFRFGEILAAHRANTDHRAADDAEIARAAGLSVALVESAAENFKITTMRDFERAERQVGMEEIRIGQGYDVHAFTDGTAVTLCGVALPHDRALKGHSDADVAMHALTDAIFGAIAEGDIGRWFPPSEPEWKGAASSIFLEKAMARVRARGGRLVNADITIVCERPKIGPHAAAMTASLSRIMAVEAGRISVKATTSEGLGFVGREEGIAATALATVALP
ncbi:bifunctional 2-C-methyl-D-erythritol 4-phosphate cytidylyltransferase/2-C-methyl-D-erythritol 2,4-cyclodiphosphate synthase [Pikeienuella piscinae]|uniref:Bifunctional enzyme IspD/IspF n=1 Tax=Pikeienuella piscinae TaxID=2748098 RepID=A0A7L5BVE9_9RHOB|nr:bifunctional 2-C-methyl-D-erythritol 4-phosphate cytidylyltransferase/2-C-methyl-D-erythritol 2,4-cyclodiphosphate synthase [Pikeienuella piscinae]QIE54467.1 bifunctional 2-C-methyl-D-erythritol 4-phosphate cytidylyltransferase/2-C-methyl-D-erythritol 2,4-cyclodiphosphate synthase [Pikeienuella piscinae]